MHTSFISTTRVNNKWQVIETNLINLTTTPVPHEDYDDEYTAKIAGTILAKIRKTSFVPSSNVGLKKENTKLEHFSQ